MPEATTATQTEAVDEILHRIAGDLSMVADREVELTTTSVEVVETRPAGAGQIHVSFRFGLRQGDQRFHGCLLVPLPDAIALACSLMMVPDDVLAESRGLQSLDGPTKDAMLEVGNFVTGAAEAALQAVGHGDVQGIFEGCQGVRADVRPALIYNEGEPLVFARASARLAGFEPSEVLLMLPAGVV